MLRHDAGLASLAVVARLHGKAADPEQLRHELALTAPARAEDLLAAAKRLEFKARLGAIDAADLARGRTPMPCIIELKDGAFAVLARIEGGQALIHETRPCTLSIEELGQRLSGRALFIASRAARSVSLRHFGFGWFIPAVVKYRKLIGE